MTRVLVFGQPYHASRIVRTLNSRAADVRATFVRPNNYVGLLARPPRSERIVIVRAGYRVGAATVRGRLFDAYWSLLRRSLPAAVGCHYWLGTDVLNTLEEANSGELRWATLMASRDDLHLAVAPWLTSELKSVGLHAITALLPPPHPAPQTAPPLPSEFRVLTYLPAARFDFYGGPVVMEAARRTPRVRFDVIGSGEEQARLAKANVHWHGWVDDMAERYAKTTVVVRIPQHDGFGNTVIESLLNARHVVYTEEVPFVCRLWPVSAEALVAVLEELLAAHDAGRLDPNLAGRAYALEEFDDEKLADNLTALIRAYASPDSG
jgi:glycosyltransferase involved in cell wall biosynthesis